ncbi:unnamed protein product [Heligmosomoides polygyrus]|uniref:Oxysterol-binding protein n=1 Tax=Heligmosomoides polygyrus TaxID=6339 RepID=A0A183GPD3_HELPZ|nr:unnamed protein product [Heligmosomoides polygyrus]
MKDKKGPKGGHRLDPVSRSNLSSSLCGVSAVSSIALAKPRLWFEDDETIEAPQSSVQYDTDFLEQDVRTKALPNFKTRKQHRRTLPAIQSPSEKISFAALGRMILQRTGVPITHYEPLTALQLLCDELRFSELLNTACSKEAAEEKMVYVAAFAASPYLNSTGRYRKFFNPLLGETYEYEQEDFKFHSEQVSHHPAVSAGHATGNGWTWFQTFSKCRDNVECLGTEL